MNRAKLVIVAGLWGLLTAAVMAPASGQNAPAATAVGGDNGSPADNGPPQTPPQSDQTAAATQSSSQLTQVVVTGTQIVRPGYLSIQPLTTVGTSDINRDAAINIADTMDKLPQLGFANTPQNSGNSVSDGNLGVNNLSLLSLGAERTLVLLDGVRVAPASITGFMVNGQAVDINEFPDQLIKRVDVVAGGASAAYGSDAVGGVVNFILDKNFTGLKLDGEGGVTTYGDDRQYKVAITYGTGFADNRGHLLLSGESDDTDGIAHGGTARSWVNQDYGVINNTAASAANGQPYYSIYNHVGNSAYTPGGLITSGPLTGTDFGAGGSTPQAFNYGSPNDGYDMVGGNYQEGEGLENQASVQSLDPQISRENIFARLSYNVTDNVQVYSQFIFADTDATSWCCDHTDNFTIDSGNPFIPASVQTEMNNLGVSSFHLGQDVSAGATGTSGIAARRRFNQYLLGGNGDFHAFGSGWSWDAYLTRSTTNSFQESIGNILKGNLALASDVVSNPTNGLPSCASTLTNPGNGCVPYDPMGTGENSQAALNYVSGSSYIHQLIGEDVGSFTLRGNPFSDWAGDVSIALGVVHRKDSVTGSADPLSATNSWYDGNFHATVGSIGVTEGFSEVLVPLLKDLPGAKELDFDGAVRETDYTTSGAVTTWKLALSYSPFSDLRFRASRSLDIRAPNLGEEFSAGLVASTPSIVDPFAGGSTVLSKTDTVGNTDLQPEKANEFTAGIVYQPSWLEGFSAAFDWYHIVIDDSIEKASEQTILNECYAGEKGFCQFIDFSVSPFLVYIEPANTASITTQGFDIDASYTKPLADLVKSWHGELNLHLLATHIGNLTTVDPAGEVIQGAGANASAFNDELWAPTWKYSLVVDYAADTYDIAWTGRGFGAGHEDPDFIQCTTTCPSPSPDTNRYTINDNHLPGELYMDLTSTYHLTLGGNPADVYLTIENFTNRNPDFPIDGVVDSPTLYDYRGRMFRMGIRVRM